MHVIQNRFKDENKKKSLSLLQLLMILGDVFSNISSMRAPNPKEEKEKIKAKEM